jgi:hypothetical protein
MHFDMKNYLKSTRNHTAKHEKLFEKHVYVFLVINAGHLKIFFN